MGLSPPHQGVWAEGLSGPVWDPLCLWGHLLRAGQQEGALFLLLLVRGALSLGTAHALGIGALSGPAQPWLPSSLPPARRPLRPPPAGGEQREQQLSRTCPAHVPARHSPVSRENTRNHLSDASRPGEGDSKPGPRCRAQTCTSGRAEPTGHSLPDGRRAALQLESPVPPLP